MNNVEWYYKFNSCRYSLIDFIPYMLRGQFSFFPSFFVVTQKWIAYDLLFCLHLLFFVIIIIIIIIIIWFVADLATCVCVCVCVCLCACVCVQTVSRQTNKFFSLSASSNLLSFLFNMRNFAKTKNLSTIFIKTVCI